MRREFEAEQLRREDQAKRDLALAWHTALFARQEKLPDLQAILKRGGKTVQELKAEQRQALEAFALRYNLKIQERVN